jgi:predicted DNA repair protein MutK
MSAGFLTLLKQAAAMSQKAAAKTLGVVGDDLAISANQLIGGQPERKLPMVMKVVKGSLKNKALMIPCALALSFTFPALIAPIMTVGGALLCFDSVDKIVHKKLKPEKSGSSEAEDNDHNAWEKRHIKRALKTDLLLSAEVTTVSMGTVVGQPFLIQLAAMSAAGLAMTAGVYGFVAGLIKFDDIGAALEKTKGKNIFAKAARGVGKAIVHAAPPLIKVIGLIGTAAMFCVGGGMLLHGIPGGEHLMATAVGSIASNTLAQGALTLAAQGAFGLASGFAALPPGRALMPLYHKAVDFVKDTVNKARHRLPAPAEDIDAEPAPLPSPDALTSVPDVKADLNAAAKPVANDNQLAPAPEAKAQPPAKKPGPNP